MGFRDSYLRSEKIEQQDAKYYYLPKKGNAYSCILDEVYTRIEATYFSKIKRRALVLFQKYSLFSAERIKLIESIFNKHSGVIDCNSRAYLAETDIALTNGFNNERLLRISDLLHPWLCLKHIFEKLRFIKSPHQDDQYNFNLDKQQELFNVNISRKFKRNRGLIAAGIAAAVLKSALFLTPSVPSDLFNKNLKKYKPEQQKESSLAFVKNIWQRFKAPTMNNYYQVWQEFQRISQGKKVTTAQQALEGLGQDIDYNQDGVVDLPEMLRYANKIKWFWNPFFANEIKAAEIAAKHKNITPHNPLNFELIMEYQTYQVNDQIFKNTYQLVEALLKYNRTLNPKADPALYFNQLHSYIRNQLKIHGSDEGVSLITEGLADPKNLKNDCDTGSFLFYAAAYEHDLPVGLLYLPGHVLIRWTFPNKTHINYETTGGFVVSDKNALKDYAIPQNHPHYFRALNTQETIAMFYNLTAGYVHANPVTNAKYHYQRNNLYEVLDK